MKFNQFLNLTFEESGSMTEIKAHPCFVAYRVGIS